jgi:hypothetical protein
VDARFSRNDLFQHFLALGTAKVTGESQEERFLLPQAGKPHRFSIDIKQLQVWSGIVKI